MEWLRMKGEIKNEMNGVTNPSRDELIEWLSMNRVTNLEPKDESLIKELEP